MTSQDSGFIFPVFVVSNTVGTQIIDAIATSVRQNPRYYMRGIWVNIRGILVNMRGIWVNIRGILVNIRGIWVNIRGILVNIRGIWVNIRGIWVNIRGIWVNIRGKKGSYVIFAWVKGLVTS